jgi:hypothetical protein
MDLPSYFDDFLTAIRPSQSETEIFKTTNRELREKLNEDESLSQYLVNTFIQGSYRRKTAIVVDTKEKSDLDIVAVTNIHPNTQPKDVHKLFVPFLNANFPEKWKPNDRSFKITLTNIEVDLVITAAPSEISEEILRSEWISDEEPPMVKTSQLVKSWIEDSTLSHFRNDSGLRQLMEKAEAAQWKLEPLLIPDRTLGNWEQTHPIAQIEWTWKKNADCNTHYINVVKAVKWWKRINPNIPKYPKGYPLEHIVGYCCPDGIRSIAEGFTLTLESIVQKFNIYFEKKSKPFLPDHGVPSHDVLARIDLQSFLDFYEEVRCAAEIARAALDEKSKIESIRLWQQLFGSTKFPGPEPDDNDDDDSGSGGSSGGFTPRTKPTVPGKGRFADE